MQKRFLPHFFAPVFVLCLVWLCTATAAGSKTAKAYHDISEEDTPSAGLPTWEKEQRIKKNLFESKIRPELFAEGFGEFGEISSRKENFTYKRQEIDNSTKAISALLWSMNPFPEVQNKLLEGLKQKDLDRETRLVRFNAQYLFLYDLLGAMEKGKEDPYVSRYGSYVGPPALFYWQKGNVAYNSSSNKYFNLLPEEEKIKEKKKDFAKKWLPIFLDLYTEDSPPDHLAKMQELGMPAFLPWRDSGNDKNSPAWEVQRDHSKEFDRLALDSLLLLWNKNSDKTFQSFAQKLFASKAGSVFLRISALNMASRYPGKTQNEYFANSVYENAFRSSGNCWDSHKESFAYGLTFSCSCGKIFENYTQHLEKSPKISTDEKGVGISLKFSPEPVFTSTSPKYLLVYSESVLPKNLQPLMGTAPSAFAGTPMEFMSNGPRIIALNKKSKDHEALMKWYIEEGGPLGRATLFSSRKKDKEIAAQTVRMHMMLWDYSPDGIRLVCSRPYSGSFFKALLPILQGKAAAHFMGALDSIWFFLPDIEGGKWYEATPEKPLPTLTAAEQASILMLSSSTRNTMGKQYEQDQIPWIANELTRKYPKPGKTIKQAYAFFNEVDKKVHTLCRGADKESDCLCDENLILELMWRVYETPVEKESTAIILAPLTNGKGYDFYDRKEKMERLLEKSPNSTNSTKMQDSSDQNSEEE